MKRNRCLIHRGSPGSELPTRVLSSWAVAQKAQSYFTHYQRGTGWDISRQKASELSMDTQANALTKHIDLIFIPSLLGSAAEQDASPHPEAEKTGNGPNSPPLPSCSHPPEKADGEKKGKDEFLVPRAALCSKIRPWHETSSTLLRLTPSSSKRPTAPSCSRHPLISSCPSSTLKPFKQSLKAN